VDGGCMAEEGVEEEAQCSNGSHSMLPRGLIVINPYNPRRIHLLVAE
jgi:hypothetical protein